jgi:hypothetical protein
MKALLLALETVMPISPRFAALKNGMVCIGISCVLSAACLAV